MSGYMRLHHQPAPDPNQEGPKTMASGYAGYGNSSEDIPLKTNVTGNWTQVDSEQNYDSKNSIPQRPTWKSFGRADTARSTTSYTAASPWEHKLNEKHFKGVPPTTDTVRYFDRGRQTRRVFLDCLVLWAATAIICGALACAMYGFSRITSGLTQFQKYGYNALVTGLSILLGFSFAAQFGQFAEMMRWRFLASEYRTLQDFELVLGCDSYRNTLRIMFGAGRKGKWYPSKTQVVACLWFLVFIGFNVCAALLGLTYSIDVSESTYTTSPGMVSVVNLKYIANDELPNDGADQELTQSMAAANLWGELGLAYDDYIYPNETATSWGYTFYDRSTVPQNKQFRFTSREVYSTAVCEEYKVTLGGYANFNIGEDNSGDSNVVEYIDAAGENYSITVENVATGTTTWIGNTSSVVEASCGPRCAQVLALQSANNCTEAMVAAGEPDRCQGVPPVPQPRLWSCTNTVSQVSNVNSSIEGFENPDALAIPDLQAQILAGGPGWSGVSILGTGLQQGVIFRGNNSMSPPGTTDAKGMAELVMQFAVGIVAAMDGSAPRQNLTGAHVPGPAQVVVVKWKYSSAILIGIPFVQFIMLLGVVWFSGKAVILEPAYSTVAHLLHPMLNRVGESGPLLSSDEMADRLGDYKIAYGVRPDPADPGHSDTTFVRDLGIIEESEGFGYIRGKMPEGRYD